MPLGEDAISYSTANTVNIKGNKPEGEISLQLKMLEDTVYALNDKILELEKLMTPILSTIPEGKESEEDNVVPFITPLSDRIRSIRFVVEGMNVMGDGLIRRIEL